MPFNIFGNFEDKYDEKIDFIFFFDYPYCHQRM